ncbi:MAG: GHMP kinase [Azospirillum sp.]|nr:GHMP kinase [Azospirillum sp.]
MLITVRAPMRVSLFGGGTDYPAYYQRHRGAVLGFSIDKFVYMNALSLGSYVDYRYRLSYSRVELVDRIEDIQHPVVRVLLAYYECDEPLDISVQADLPESAGLGSSSSFTVALIQLISTLKGQPRTKIELAREAIHAEQVLLNENVGIQDQLHAAIGGINRFDFERDGLTVRPMEVTGADLRNLSKWMVLIYTGIKRRATDVVAEQVKQTAQRTLDTDLSHLLDLVDQGQRVLERSHGDEKAIELAKLLHESWMIKRSLTGRVTNPEIDALYETCLANGALGGKLCGAGGGGFLLMIVPPEHRAHLAATIGSRRCIDFTIDFLGSTVNGITR